MDDASVIRSELGLHLGPGDLSLIQYRGYTFSTAQIAAQECRLREAGLEPNLDMVLESLVARVERRRR